MAAEPAPAPELSAVAELPAQINAFGDKAAQAMVQKLADHSDRDQWQHSAAVLLVTLAIVFAADRLSRGAWHRFAGQRLTTEQRHRIRRRLAWVRKILLGGLLGGAGLAAIQLTGLFDVLALLGSEWGRRLLSGLINIILVLAVAVLFWEVLRAVIEHYLLATDADGNQLQRSGRVRTLLPLVRNAAFIMLVLAVGLIVLSELGINVAPVLAGAGVIGIAVGFGSQKLVQDIITGAFILFEDTIAVGDVVKLGEHAGTVEAISIRAIRLRDAQGALHTVPFGAVSTVINSSRGFNYAVFDVDFAYGEDTDRVADELKAIGAEMQADERWAAAMLEPLEVLGVERFAASSVVLRARVKVIPGERFAYQREFNTRLKKHFDAAGIEIPFQQVQIWTKS
jgi:moderate conductance mechanosensitive channel